jgi:hypothetical protein
VVSTKSVTLSISSSMVVWEKSNWKKKFEKK